MTYKSFALYIGNPFKRRPTNVYFYILGFGLSFFGASKLAVIRVRRNPKPVTVGYEYSSKIIWSTKVDIPKQLKAR
jgi:hypothetical protein